MKKKFILVMILLFSGVCFSLLDNNAPKACCKTTTAGCKVMVNGSRYKIEATDVYDAEDSPDMFMNPFTQL